MMNKKIVVIIIFLLIITVAAIVAFLSVPSFYNQEIKLPQYISKVEKITINNGMTIERKMGSWCSKEDDFYPVNTDVVDALIENLRRAALYAEKYVGEHEEKDEIDLVDEEGNVLKLSFNEINGHTSEIVALNNGQKTLLKGDFAIPAQPYQWFEQPLLKLNNSDIEEISGVEPGDFSFDDLLFYQATKNNDFAEWMTRQINVVLKNGLTIKLIVYTRGHSYWVSLNLGTTVMPTKDADEFVKNNGFLYDGWFFELPQPVGNRLFGTIDENDYIPR